MTTFDRLLHSAAMEPVPQRLLFVFAAVELPADGSFATSAFCVTVRVGSVAFLRFLDAPLPNDPGATLTRERLHELVAEYHRQRGG